MKQRILNQIKKLVKNTLQKNNIWSRTSLTWLVSFAIANVMAFYDLYKNGFNFATFSVYIAYAFTLKYNEQKKEPVKTGSND